MKLLALQLDKRDSKNKCLHSSSPLISSREVRYDWTSDEAPVGLSERVSYVRASSAENRASGSNRTLSAAVAIYFGVRRVIGLYEDQARTKLLIKQQFQASLRLFPIPSRIPTTQAKGIQFQSITQLRCVLNSGQVGKNSAECRPTLSSER